MKSAYQLIESQSALKRAAKRLAAEKNIAVDLESDSMYHFREKVCLLQVATKSENFIIDPLKITDLSPLKPVFQNENIRKVFHGADYDIRSLFRDFQFEVNSLFDTQMASRFLGYEETGLEALLQKFFSVSLNKRFQKKDWSQRPLPLEMMDYAADDAIHLIPLARILEKKLREQKRLAWVKEECLLLSQVRPTAYNHTPLYLNFKGAGSLGRENLAVLEALLQLRRQIAEKKDRPLFKVFQNAAIAAIARHRPRSKKRLMNIHALSNAQIEMHGDAIIGAIKEAQQIDPKDMPIYPKKQTPVFKMRDQDRMKALKEWKDAKSRELGIEPSLVLGKPAVASIAVGNPKTVKDLKTVKEAKTWQIKEFGKDILSVLKSV